jgi:penicillin-binding protein 2
VYFDWQRFRAAQYEAPAVVDPQRRLQWCWAGFALLLCVVFARVVQLQWTAGEAFRQRASHPIQRPVAIPGIRGRILSRDGAVLAVDRQLAGLAVHYRYLEEPCDPGWLRLAARARLTPAQRKQPQCLAAATEEVLRQRTDLAQRICQLCGLSSQQWERRRGQIQSHVQQIAEAVRRRHAEAAENPASGASRGSASPAGPSLRSFLLDTLKAAAEPVDAGRIVVAEERQYHVIVNDVSPAVVAQVEAQPELYPGVKIVPRWQRTYPHGMLAAHTLGYVGPPEPSSTSRDGLPDFVGRTGLERHYESVLRGRAGEALELVDHSGRLISTQRVTEPAAGRDLILTLDSRLQQVAETLLDQSLARRAVLGTPAGSPSGADPTMAKALGGGAVVVLDVQTGALLVAASAPRFDPGWFAQGSSDAIAAVLADPEHPLFDRVATMALPPGSVFKIVTAIALLESPSFHAEAAFTCRGYLDTPDHWRCESFVRHGRGHGPVTLADALAQSCNVYFFDHARQLGPKPLVDWATRLGFGQLTGRDLPQEARGTLPTLPGDCPNFRPSENGTVPINAPSCWRIADTLELCIGQGAITATPLQIARLLAAVANGGRLVTPHCVDSSRHTPCACYYGTGDVILSRAETPVEKPDIPPPQEIAGLHQRTLAVLRDGLARVVSDPHGTAHDTLQLDTLTVAGKTGTAQTGPGQADHAWFAGYVPAEQPRFAIVAVLEHGGDAALATGPLVKRLIVQMQDLGLL